MSDTTAAIPRFPPLVAQSIRVLPMQPLSFALTNYARKVAENHPELFRRLGEHSHTRYVLDPTDLPFFICLDPNGGRPQVTATRRNVKGAARIAGPLAALLGLVHGAYDGDALFFSRDLVIEGDTAAALALRNAIDNAELDLAQELSARAGRFSAPLRRIVEFLEHRTGACLTRPKEAKAW